VHCRRYIARAVCRYRRDLLISKLQAAAASKSGTVPFHIATDSVFSSLYPTSSVIRVIEVRAFSLPDLFDLVEVRPLDLLKMDIKGAEIVLDCIWRVLNVLPLAPA
jgi:FkbM family methyltransferase